MKLRRAGGAPPRLHLGEPRSTTSRDSVGRSNPRGDATTRSGSAPACSRMSVARRARVTSSDGGTRSNGGVSPAGKIASAGAAGPHAASPRRRARPRRRRPGPCARSLAQPPRDQADRARRARRATMPAPARWRARPSSGQLVEALAQRCRRHRSRGGRESVRPARFQTFMAASSPSRMIATAMVGGARDRGLGRGTLVGKEGVEHVLDQVVAVAGSCRPRCGSAETRRCARSRSATAHRDGRPRCRRA